MIRGILKKKALLAITAALILLIATVAVICLIGREDRLEKLQNEALLELYEKRGEYDEQTIVLHGTTKVKATQLAESLGASLRITNDGRFATLTLPEGTTILDVYADDSNKRHIEEMSANFYVSPSDITEEEETTSLKTPMKPDYPLKDELIESQIHLDYVNVGKAWHYSNGDGITVAVIDTGIDTDHPEFAGRISEYSYNVSTDRIVKDTLLENGEYDWSIIEDPDGHGTAVTGALAASMNSTGVVGVAPNVNLLVIKAALNSCGHYSSSDLVFAIYYAIERDVSVINMSFGGSNDNYSEVIRLAYDSDIMCVASAGNDSTAAPQYPAACEYVFSVGALAYGSWELADYSNYGDTVDLVAPGTVYTTLMGGKFGNMSGTSLSSPLVAGAIALYLNRHKYIDFHEMEAQLRASCYDIGTPGPDTTFGYGALDVHALIYADRGTITFDMMCDDLDDVSKIFVENVVLQDIPTPERLYSVFDGWYYDEQCTEEFVPYETAFNTDVTLYAKWANEDDSLPFTYVILDNGTVEITGYTGTRRYISIPTHIEGLPVTSIGNLAFCELYSLRSVIIPSTVTRIGVSAFRGCYNLLEISIPESVTEIGIYAFSDCTRLTSISFGSNSKVTSIGSCAFANCAALKAVDIPASCTSIDGSVFSNATSLMRINVSPDNTALTAVDGVLYNTDKTRLIAYPAGRNGEYDIPDGVLHIDKHAFVSSKITEIDLTGIKSIGANAFSGSDLVSVTIPDTVEIIGVRAFSYCSYLKSVTLGKSLVSIPDHAFASSGVTSVTIPAGTKTIAAFAFSATPLKELTFADGSVLESIGASAFHGTLITEVKFPSSLALIGNAAFGDTTLEKVTFEENSSLKYIIAGAFSMTENLKSISLPNGLESIGSLAFAQSGIERITIPASVTDMDGAFANCDKLTEIKIDKDNVTYKDIDGVVFSAGGDTLVQYPSGKQDTEYTVPAGVTVIGDLAFMGSDYLRAPNLPDTLEYIDEEAFSNCTALSYVRIPSSTISIGRLAFSGDWALDSISFDTDAKLSRIGMEAFAYCGLTSFLIPKNITTIGQKAFYGCKSLSCVSFATNSKLEYLPAYVFYGCDNLREIIFNNGTALTSLQAHSLDGLKNLTSIRFADAKLTNIDNYAFRFCESLYQIEIPDSVINIGRFAFYGCSSLSEITLPEGLEHVGRYAFFATNDINVYFEAESMPLYTDDYWDVGVRAYFTGVSEIVSGESWVYAILKSGNIGLIEYLGSETVLDLSALDLGGNIVNIGGSTFEDSAVTSVKLPSTLANIQANAFYNAPITEITIPAGVTFIGKDAFKNTNLSSLTFSDNCALSVIERGAFSYIDELKAVRIPASVTFLGEGVFERSGIEAVAFEDGFSLEKLPARLFGGTKLASIVIPDSVSYIDSGAFVDILTLKSVTFGNPESLSIQSNAFYNTGLTSVYIPKHVSYIGEYAFNGLRDLTAFTVDDDNPYYAALDGMLVTKDLNKLIACPGAMTGSYTVPSCIEVLGIGAFENSSLTNICFAPDTNILSIGPRCFFGAEKLTSLDIPSSVISISYYSFANCASLQEVRFAEGSSLRGIYEGAFSGCSSLCSITLPDSIVEIADFAFYGCISLEDLPVEDNGQLTLIGSHAMAFTGIKELHIPDSVLEIGDHAFMGIRIKELTIPDANKKLLLIGLGAFEDCRELESVTVPFIGASYDDPDVTWFAYIFGAPNYLFGDVFVPESLKTVTVTDGITRIGAYAFNWLGGIEKINLPHSITLVDHWAFMQTTATYELTNVIQFRALIDSILPVYNTLANGHVGEGLRGHLRIAEGTEHIEWNAIAYSRNIEELTLPESVKSISNTSINYLESLERINVADLDSFLRIETDGSPLANGSYLYHDGELVTDIVVPEGVEKLYFSGAKGVESVYVPSSVRTLMLDNCTDLKVAVIAEGIETLGYAFRECSSLTSVNIPLSVKNIDGAFYNCSSLQSIELHDGITSMSDSFIGCSSLESIRIPLGINVLGGFSECSSLKTVELHSGITRIKGHAFSNCISLVELKNASHVTHIESSAFYNCDSLVTLPDVPRLTAIESHAFYDCDGLKTVDIHDNVTEIGQSAFEGCDSLVKLTIGNGIKELKSAVFSGCTLLSEVTIGENVESFEWDAFYRNNYLYAVYNNSDLPIGFHYQDFGYLTANAHVIYNKNGEVLTREFDSFGYYRLDSNGMLFNYQFGNIYLVAYVGTEDIVTLPADAFGEPYEIRNFKGATHVIIPEGFTSFGDSAFQYNTSIVSVTLPSTTKTIPDNAFWDCEKLERINIPEGVTSIGRNAFLSCSSLTDLLLPDSLTAIGDNAFANCSSIGSIVIPDNVTEIGSQAFSNCGEITALVIGGSVQSIGESAFSGCSTSNISLAEGNDNLVLRDGILYNKDMTYFVYVPSNITSVTIPSSILGIANAFYERESLRQVIFEEGSSLTSIDDRAFSGCISLEKIDLPDSVTEIGDEAFARCHALSDVSLPDYLKSIGSSAFRSCSELEEIVLPLGLESIGGWAFAYCDNMARIVIPESVTSIGFEAFVSSYYSSHMDVFIYDLEAWMNIDFGGSSSSPLSNGADLYLNGELVTYVEFPEGMTEITGVIAGCTSIVGVKLPDSATKIAEGAFYECSSLLSVDLPDGIETIPYSAFNGCRSLTHVGLPKNLKTIQGSAFSNCDSLTDITLPNGLTHIGPYAFSSTGITDIVIPDSVTTIDYCSFSNSAVKSITLGKGVTYIDPSAFSGSTPYLIYNNSALDITIGSTDHGEIARQAVVLVDRNGNVSIRGAGDYGINHSYNYYEGFEIYEDFIYGIRDGKYYLFHYFGSEETVTLPSNINGKGYELYQLSGIVNAIIPEGITHISPNAFTRSEKLKTVSIPRSVTSIGAYAFAACPALEMPYLHDGITYIGEGIFDGCTFFLDQDNWENNAFYAHGYLIDANEYAEFVREDILGIADKALDSCASLKKITLGGDCTFPLVYYSSNIETLVITEAPSHSILRYFSPELASLKNVILKKDVFLKNTNLFDDVTGITIYLEATAEEAKHLDENFPGWANGNKVVYGDKWITANFYTPDGGLYYSTIVTTSQVIRLPYVSDYDSGAYHYSLAGFDTNGDGIRDSIPATSYYDIDATILYSISCLHLNTTDVAEKAASCTESGYGYSVCDGCGERTGEWTEDAHGHRKYHIGYKAPTCEESGWEAHYVCTVCGVTTYTEIEALGHDKTVYEGREPDCYFNGWHEYFICSRCGYSSYEEIPSPGHRFEAHVYEVGCMNDGYTEYRCACGEYYCTDYVWAIGHEYEDSWTVDVAPGCETWGEGSRHCIRCEASTGHIYIDPTGHSFGEWHEVSAPSCATTGKKERECAACHAKEEEEIETVPHTPESEWKVYSEPTCTEQGVSCRYCSACRQPVEFSYSASLGHTFGEWYVTVPSTCTETGVKEHECSVCHTKEEGILAKADHTLSDDWIIDAEPNCTTAGIKHRICTVCQKIIITSITSSSGHRPDIAVTENLVEATCTTDGSYDSVTYCVNCKEELSRSHHTVEKLGHAYADAVKENAVEPTCTASGSFDSVIYCTTCREEIARVHETVEALGHTHADAVKENVIDPTCTASGSFDSVVYCATCKEELSRSHNEVEALGHTTDEEWVVELDPTCTEDGNKSLYCKECNTKVETAAIPAKGHEFGDWEEVTPPTYDSTGSEKRVCDTCSEEESRTVEPLGLAQKFRDHMSSLSDGSVVEVRYGELYAAMEIYSGLTLEEKSEVKAEYDLMLNLISQYNSTASAANSEMADATETAFSPLVATGFAFLAALWFFIRKKFFI